MKEIYRQGDMIIFKLNDQIGANQLKNQKRLTVGLGEVSGHEHEVTCLGDSEIIVELHESLSEVTKNDLAEMDRLLFEIKGGSAIISHEEHNPILLSEGTYLRLNQLEFNPYTQELNKVRD